MPLGAGDGYPEKKSRTLFLPEPTRSCHCDLHGLKETSLERTDINAHARQEKDSNASYKTLKMSTDAKKLKLFAGDEKEDWKFFYDEAIRICRQELGSEAVKWRVGAHHVVPGRR